jgi:hypothetical protein
MASHEKDPPAAADYKKSQENKGFQVPDILASKFGMVVGLGTVVVIVGVIYAIGHLDLSRPVPNPLESRPGFASLKQHVESLAEVDVLCAGGTERLTCLCELADRIRDERHAVDSILASDPALKGFAIEVRHPASAAVTYDFAKLPKVPEESECLNAVAAPTLLDDDMQK